MSLFTVALFLHVSGAIGAFISLGIWGAVLQKIKARSNDLVGHTLPDELSSCNTAGSYGLTQKNIEEGVSIWPLRSQFWHIPHIRHL
jgi:hypothetical protein